MLSTLGLTDLPLTVERHVLHWFQPGSDPGAFALGRHPVYLWEYEHGAEFYGFPSPGDGCGAKVSYFHQGGPASTRGSRPSRPSGLGLRVGVAP